jgi:hypothetical protein
MESGDPVKARKAIDESYAALEAAGLLEKSYVDSEFKTMVEEWGKIIGPVAKKYDVEINALIVDTDLSYSLAGPYSSGIKDAAVRVAR